MAKSKSSRGRAKPPGSLTVTLRSPATSKVVTSLPFDLRSKLEPDPRPARLFSGGVARIDVVPPKKHARQAKRPRVQLGFTAPSETLVCVRRGRRREVLFAKFKTGKAGQRKPRRSPWSSYKCGPR